MSSKKRLARIDQALREEEVMNSPVRMDGVGEDPVIKALLSDQFVEGSNKNSLDIALALQALVRGQGAILNQIQGQGEAITKLTERMNKMDKASEAWNRDRQGFIENVQEKAEALKIKNPEEKAKLIAREALHVQQEIQLALANKTVDEMGFKQWMENQPKVTVTSPGKMVTVNQGGVIQAVMEPESIRIRNLEWILSPNIPTDVPKPVADEFYARQKILSETIDRKKILNADKPMENVAMAQEWQNINQRYGSHTDMMQAEDRE